MYPQKDHALLFCRNFYISVYRRQSKRLDALIGIRSHGSFRSEDIGQIVHKDYVTHDTQSIGLRMLSAILAFQKEAKRQGVMGEDGKNDPHDGARITRIA